MRLLIYGVGGVGGVLGAHLERADFDVSYVARGKRFQCIQRGMEGKVHKYEYC